jgi:DNA-binding FadR family transcriptional regulator
MIFQRIGSKDRLVDRVAGEIQQLMINGRLKPGMKLPAEREFAEQIGVSRTIVREAVHILVAKGLLETKHGVGTVVCDMDSSPLIAPLNLLLLMRGITVENLHQVRSILETEIAFLAAGHPASAEITKLQAIVARMAPVIGDPLAFANEDEEFHRCLAQMTNNPLLLLLLDSIAELMREVRLSVAQRPALLISNLADHRRILECVLNGDGPGARLAMQEHLEHARQIQEEYIAEFQAKNSSN